MAHKLVHVGKKRIYPVYFPEARHQVTTINPHYVEMDSDNNTNNRFEGELFIVDERDLTAVLAVLAEENPGKDVSVYSLESVSICPAAELVTKLVTKDGVLPS